MAEPVAYPIPPSGPTSRELIDYITSIAFSNETAINDKVDALVAVVAAMPVHTRSDVMPVSAKIGDTWTATSTSQTKECNTTYVSGAGAAEYWSARRDTATLSVATASGALAATKVYYGEGTDWPSDFTKGWIFKDTSTGIQYIANQTYVGVGAEAYFDVYVDSTARASVLTVQTQVNNIADDDIVTSQEKLALKIEYDRVVLAYTNLSTLATTLTLTTSSEYVAYKAAYDALVLYLGSSNINLFASMTTDTTLSDEGSSKSEYDTKWNTYYDKEMLFSNKVQYQTNTSINTAQSEDIITENESKKIRIEWQAMTDEKAEFITLATDLEMTAATVYTDYITAFTAVDNYLRTAGTPHLDLFNPSTEYPLDLTATTPASSGAAYIVLFNTFYEKERALARTFSTNIKVLIDSLGDDGVISAGTEKAVAVREWKNIRDHEYALIYARATQLIDGLSSDVADLTSARLVFYNYYNGDGAGIVGLGPYITGLTSFLTLTVDTAVDDGEWDDAWSGYYDARTLLTDEITKVANREIINNVVNQETLDDLTSDGVISAGMEKRRLITLYEQIEDEYTEIAAKAASVANGTDSSAYTAAYTNLINYLHSLATIETKAGFMVVTESLEGITPTEFTTYFNNYYAAREALETSILSNLYNAVNRDSVSLPNIALDGTVSVEEKALAKSYWDRINGNGVDGAGDDAEHYNLQTQATNLSVAAGTITDFDDAYAVLEDYLYDLSNASYSGTSLSLFDNMGVEKTLTSTEQGNWVLFWADYYTQRDVIQAAITTKLNDSLLALLPLDGSRAMTGALDMDSHKITGVTAGTVDGTSTDATNGTQLNARDEAIALRVLLDGTAAMTGALNMNSHAISNLTEITLANGNMSAATVNQVYDEQEARISADGTLTSDVANKIDKTTVTGQSIASALTVSSGNVQVTGTSGSAIGVSASGTGGGDAAVLGLSRNSAGAASSAVLFGDEINGSRVAIGINPTYSDYLLINPSNANLALNCSDKRIEAVAAPVNGTDVANKNYVLSTANTPIAIAMTGDTTATNTMTLSTGITEADWNSTGFLFNLCFGGVETGGTTCSISGNGVWIKAIGNDFSHIRISGSGGGSHNDGLSLTVYMLVDITTTDTLSSNAIIQNRNSVITSCIVGSKTSGGYVCLAVNLTSANTWVVGHPSCAITGIKWTL